MRFAEGPLVFNRSIWVGKEEWEGVEAAAAETPNSGPAGTAGAEEAPPGGVGIRSEGGAVIGTAAAVAPTTGPADTNEEEGTPPGGAVEG